MKNKSIPVNGSQEVTPKEIELIQQVANEMRPKEIATQRGVSKKTVESQLMAVKNKFSRKTIPGLVALFFRHKLID